MGESLGAVSTILFSWMLIGSVIVGLGLGIRRFLGLGIQGAASLFSSFWFGFAFAIFALQLWHFAFRVDWRAFVLVSLAGVAGLVWNIRGILNWAGENAPLKRPYALILTLVAIWLANRAMGPPVVFDSGLYHLNAVRWTTSFPIVPGLGNLHGRLAFNSSFFLWAGMLDVGPWAFRSSHIANGLLLLALAAEICLCGLKLVFKKSAQPADIYCFIFAGPVLRECLKPYISSPVPELPVFTIGIVLGKELLSSLCNSNPASPKETRFSLLLIAALAAVGTTVKLSFAAFGGAALAIASIAFAARSGENRIRTIAMAAACAAALLAPWIIRNIVLSGYLVYPSAIGSLPVEWRIPAETAIGEMNWVRSWARAPGFHWSEVLGNWAWFGPWLQMIQQSYFEVVTPLVLFFAGLFFYFVRTIVQKQRFKPLAFKLMFFLPPIAHLAFWFVSAPDLRFAGAGMWILAAGAIAIAVCGPQQTKSKLIPIIVFISALLILVIPHCTHKHWIVPPGIDHGLHASPKVEMKTFVTRSGLKIYTPKTGEQCWESPLPCTPYPQSNLRLRRSGDLGGGFMVD